MRELARTLVVHASSVERHALTRALRAQCGAIVTAASRREAELRIRERGDLTLVVSESSPACDGLGLLDYVSALPAPHPAMILIAPPGRAELAKGAVDRGAAAVLTPPVGFNDVARALKEHRGAEWHGRPGRARLIGEAFMTDPRDEVDPRRQEWAHLGFGVRDLSATGAFVETRGPIPVGTELDLAIVVGAAMAHVRVEVVRVQEPGWGSAGGVGVRFTSIGEGSQRLLDDYLDRLRPGGD